MEVDATSSMTAGTGLLQFAGQKSGGREPTTINGQFHAVRFFQVMQSLRTDKVFCDVKLVTDDGAIVFGHKNVLASASPYFYAMFTDFKERNEDNVNIKEIDSTALKLLVDFMYTGKIMITEENVQALLPAANIFQLHDVQAACSDFFKTRLHPTNCFGIKTFADLHGCIELSSSCQSYIEQHFSELIAGEDFLSLSFEKVVKLISSDELTIPSEETVFECIISWVNHNSSCRKDMLPRLMEYVRLPLTSELYLINRVQEERLIKSSFECTPYIIEALNFHLLKSIQPDTIPKTNRTKPRQYIGSKVILMVGGDRKTFVEWYDPATNRWLSGPKLSIPRQKTGLTVLNNNHVFAVGGHNGSPALRKVDILDLSSPSPRWVPTVPMLKKRQGLGVAVLDKCIYAVGGFDGLYLLHSAEVFDCITREWRMISNMSTRRSELGVGVLNNLLYAVGGTDENKYLKSVECYHPSTDTWVPVAEMCVRRYRPCVGVLDGIMYAIGGYSENQTLSSVEAYRPSIGVWTLIADMHMCRWGARVIALNGLLYVFGGYSGQSNQDSIEIYNPNSNTWSILPTSTNITHYFGLGVVDKPPEFNS